MSAAVWTGPDVIDVVDVDVPRRGPGEVLIEVERVGICGTDLAILHGAHPRAASGLIPGHEIVGVVAEADPDGPAVGTRVAVEPLLSCGKCRACLTGSTHVCSRLGLYGIDVPGGLARYVTLPAAVLHEVPAEVPVDAAALVEPLAVAVHAVRLAEVAEGDVVAIYGAGPIGVLVAMVAQHVGAAHVVIVEPHEWRRGVADTLGFQGVANTDELIEVMKPITGGEGADVTFDSAGHPAVAADLAEVTRVLGTIAMVAVHKRPAEVDLRALCFKEQRMVGVRVYTTQDFADAIAMIAGDLDLSAFPIAHFGLGAVQEAFSAAAEGSDALKVLVSTGGSQ
ncbi:MAG: alcohol dehydrogenase catalytic domain-containing protein [Demequina sp.]